MGIAEESGASLIEVRIMERVSVGGAESLHLLLLWEEARGELLPRSVPWNPR